MPTAKLFSQIPPFPDNVPTANLGTLSFTKLLSNDQTESEELFRSCQEAGFFQLDLHGSPEGEALLREAEELFELNREVSELSTEEKMKYVWNAPKSLFGYVFLFESFKRLATRSCLSSPHYLLLATFSLHSISSIQKYQISHHPNPQPSPQLQTPRIHENRNR